MGEGQGQAQARVQILRCPESALSPVGDPRWLTLCMGIAPLWVLPATSISPSVYEWASSWAKDMCQGTQ